MKKNYHRIIVILIGLCVWTAYIFQKELGRYALYSIVSYTGYELLSILVYSFIPLTALCTIFVAVKIIRKKGDKSDMVFVVLLALLFVVQKNILTRDVQWETSGVATVTDVNKYEHTVTIVTGKEGYEQQTIQLDCPQMFLGLIEENRQYAVTFVRDSLEATDGELRSIEIIE
ncbi:MAG: hypothetical protein IJ362_00435 [Oscillospiraceae bacterium]|nr:hypothetical protein [Oscillospiraceae bacterium]